MNPIFTRNKQIINVLIGISHFPMDIRKKPSQNRSQYCQVSQTTTKSIINMGNLLPYII